MWKATCTKFGYLVSFYEKVIAQNISKIQNLLSLLGVLYMYKCRKNLLTLGANQMYACAWCKHACYR